MSKSIDWLEFWYAALNSPRGVVLAVSDTTLAKQRLYQARAKSGDPDLVGIAIRTSPVLPKEELWLIRQLPTTKPKVPSDGSQG